MLPTSPAFAHKFHPFLLTFSSLSPRVTILPLVPFDRVTKSLRGRYSGRFLDEKIMKKCGSLCFKA